MYCAVEKKTVPLSISVRAQCSIIENSVPASAFDIIFFQKISRPVRLYNNIVEEGIQNIRVIDDINVE